MLLPNRRSSQRRPRWTSPVRSSSIPQSVLSLSLSARSGPERAGQTEYEFELSGWSAIMRRRKPGQPDLVSGRKGTSDDQFWAYLASVTHSRRNVWIICPDAQSAFQAIGGWIQSDRGVVGWGTLGQEAKRRPRGANPRTRPFRGTMILSPAVTILCHSLGEGRCTWVSVSNYLATDLQTLARSVGEEWPESLDVGQRGAAFQSDTDRSAKIVDRFFNRIMVEYLKSDGGHWRTTAAQLSHQTWRRNFLTHRVESHTDDDAAVFERDATFGGRAELYFLGTVGVPPGERPGESPGMPPISPKQIAGPLYKVDIRSQYPAILRDNYFPVQLDRRHRNPPVEEVVATANVRCCVARVLIETTLPIYPCRTNERMMTDKRYDGRETRVSETKIKSRVVYPIGRFWTSLYGPELAEAGRRGHIQDCAEMWTYRGARAFRDYADYLITERKNARDRGDESSELRLKLQANSFIGKFASRGGGWSTVPRSQHEERWKQWFELDLETGKKEQFRTLSGITQRFDPPAEVAVGCPFVFGYVTSYGRIQLYRIIETAGKNGVVQCNTDGLLLTPSGYQCIEAAGLLSKDKPGRLRTVETVDRFRGWGPSHFFASGEWTLSGYRGGTWIDASGRAVDWHYHGISSLISCPESTATKYTVQKKNLILRPLAGSVGEWGWTKTLAIGRYGAEVHAAIEAAKWEHHLPFG